ncbi:MAG: hypothetical protein F4X77_03475 [Acidobacteriia bacterium]|nr:hypothetical protein [Terriglobia bacterium]
MSTHVLTRLTGASWLRVGILVIIVAAAAMVWLTRSSERPVLAISHMSLNEIDSRLYAELKAIHGGEVCGEMETSTPDASGYSARLAAEHEGGLPSQRVIDLLEAEEHSFDQVDDYHIAGSRIAFVAYAETKERDSLVTLASGRQVHGSVSVMHALSGGERGEDRWEFVHRSSYWICEPPD